MLHWSASNCVRLGISYWNIDRPLNLILYSWLQLTFWASHHFPCLYFKWAWLYSRSAYKWYKQEAGRIWTCHHWYLWVTYGSNKGKRGVFGLVSGRFGAGRGSPMVQAGWKSLPGHWGNRLTGQRDCIRDFSVSWPHSSISINKNFFWTDWLKMRSSISASPLLRGVPLSLALALTAPDTLSARAKTPLQKSIYAHHIFLRRK